MQHPPHWSSDEMKCCACSREEGTLQRLNEKVCLLVFSGDLGETWLASWKAIMGRTAASLAWMLAASVSRTGTRFVDYGTAGAMILAGPVGGGGLSSAMSSSDGGIDSSAARG
jgi:hypothetical protein